MYLLIVGSDYCVLRFAYALHNRRNLVLLSCLYTEPLYTENLVLLSCLYTEPFERVI